MFLGSILLENNRWKDRRNPLFQLDPTWAARIANAGFSGIELWEPHYSEIGESARAKLSDLVCPIRIFNSYISLAENDAGQEARLIEAASVLSKTLLGIKFNFGKDRDNLEQEIEALGRISSALPPGVKLLCECHGGTSVEEPEAAAEAFAALPEERFAVIVHPFSMQRLEDWFRLLGPRIEHLHLQARDENGKWLAPQPGQPDVNNGLRILKQSGFRGTATLEFTRGITCGQTADELLKQAAADRAALIPHLTQAL